MRAVAKDWIDRCRRVTSRLSGEFLNLASPACCPACGRELIAVASLDSPHLCTNCHKAATAPDAGQCPQCGAPIGPFVDAAQGCVRCRTERFHFETVICLGAYQSKLGEMCVAAKGQGAEELAAALADLLWHERQAALLGARANLVVPVPHHWTENFRSVPHVPRTLGAVLAARLRLPFRAHILSKVRRTPRQTSLSPSRRRVNLKGAFRVSRRLCPQLEGRRVLLIDDVLTTGATADAAARALIAAKAASVIVAVIARGLGRRPTTSRNDTASRTD
jgi:ComF family protein